MSMSKKDYELIAERLRLAILSTALNPVMNKFLVAVARDFADSFEKDNPKFNRDKFLDACDAWERS